ncbi:MAG: hypothetical protein WAV90_19245 [Gordonia amarae]
MTVTDIRPGDRVQFTLMAQTEKRTGTVAEIVDDLPGPIDPARSVTAVVIDDDLGGQLVTPLFNVEKFEG